MFIIFVDFIDMLAQGIHSRTLRKAIQTYSVCKWFAGINTSKKSIKWNWREESGVILKATVMAIGLSVCLSVEDSLSHRGKTFILNFEKCFDSETKYPEAGVK